MKNLLFTLLSLFILGCSSEPEIMESEFLGTYVLSNVSGTCLGLPISGTADEGGCIDLPAIEVNCSIIELAAGGITYYTENQIKKQGTFTIDKESTITICADQCREFSFNGVNFTMRTGSVADCDPTYTYTPSASTLDEILAQTLKRRIKSISLNGKETTVYKYNTDGSIQAIQNFDNDGNLFNNTTYTFTPLSATLTVTYFNGNPVRRYEYYDESPTRTRRDYYLDNQLESYRLYFHDPNGCWIDRSEDYTDNQLSRLNEYSYSGETCDLDYSEYRNGELTLQSMTKYDGMTYSRESTLLNILKYRNISNTTSRLFIYEGEVSTSSSFNSTFTYGEGGYPESEIRTFLDGDVNVYAYEYE